MGKMGRNISDEKDDEGCRQYIAKRGTHEVSITFIYKSKSKQDEPKTPTHNDPNETRNQPTPTYNPFSPDSEEEINELNGYRDIEELDPIEKRARNAYQAVHNARVTFDPDVTDPEQLFALG